MRTIYMTPSIFDPLLPHANHHLRPFSFLSSSLSPVLLSLGGLQQPLRSNRPTNLPGNIFGPSWHSLRDYHSLLLSSSARQIATYHAVGVMEEAAIAVLEIHWLVVVYIFQWAMSRSDDLGRLCMELRGSVAGD